MHLIQSLKNEFCFDLPMFSKYPATSINSYFYKMTLGHLYDNLRLLDLNVKYIKVSQLLNQSYHNKSSLWQFLVEEATPTTTTIYPVSKLLI